MEMQMRAMSASSELNAVKTQEASLQRKIRLSEATEAELVETTAASGDDGESRIWQGVGKMFLSCSVTEQTKQLQQERADYNEQIIALGKKKLYLETTYKNVTAALNELTLRK